MLPPAHKVALLTHVSSAYVSRLILGALAFTENTEQNIIITRAFHLTHQGPDEVDANSRELDRLRIWNPDGLLCALESDTLQTLVEFLPRPTVNMFASQPGPGVAVVLGSRATFIQTGAQHLRQQGLRSIAQVVLSVDPAHQLKLKIFNQVVRPAKPGQACLYEPVPPALLEDPYMPVTPVPARLAAWLRALPKPSGVISPSNGGGGYLIRVCHELGLRVPEDIAVVGVDGTDLALASELAVTTVLPDAQAIGRAAMTLLGEMMRGQPAPPEPVLQEAMELHVRKSTGLRRAEICDITGALEYIDHHACTNLSVEQLIRDTQGVCTKTFYTHFRAATGQTPAQAIQHRRLEEARRLLAHTELPVSTIADLCGYSDYSNFGRAFRAAEKISPSAYRQQKIGLKLEA